MRVKQVEIIREPFRTTGSKAILLQFWLPDSPRWLMLSGQGKPAARSAVERLRGRFADEASVQGEVEDMAKSCQSIQAKAGELLSNFVLPDLSFLSVFLLSAAHGLL